MSNKNRQRRGGIQSNHNNSRGAGGYRNSRGGTFSRNNNNNSISHSNSYRGDSSRGDVPFKPEGIYHNHSVLAALSHLVGRTVLVRTKNDGMYDGIFCTLSPKAAFVLKCVHKLEKKASNGVNGIASLSPTRDDLNKELVFDFKDIISISGKIEKPKPEPKDKFLVDSDVGRQRLSKAEPKELQRWEGGDDQLLTDMTLDSGSAGNGWAYEDMIRTNEEKFNVPSLFDESLAEYTVPVPECDEETKRKATALAEDIEKKVTSNVHIAEERGQIIPIDITEEDRYSAVVRPSQFIEITEPRKRYSADIPAPLSQIDEPTEDVFKEEKEAALKKQLNEVGVVTPTTLPVEVTPNTALTPDTTPTSPPDKCVGETQTDVSPAKSAPKISTARSVPSSPQVTSSSSATHTESKKSGESPSVQSSSLKQLSSPVATQPQSTPKRKGDDDAQVTHRQIMKSERSRKEERKETLMNFKNKYEDSTQNRGSNKVPATVAQTTALPAHQTIPQTQVPQQPIAVSQQPITVSQQPTPQLIPGSQPQIAGAPQPQIPQQQQIPQPQMPGPQTQIAGPPAPPQMMPGKQRNDSMSSESSYTMGPQFQQQRHSLTHMQGVYNPALMQQQQQQQQQMMHIQQSTTHQQLQLQLHQQQQIHLQQHLHQQQQAMVAQQLQQQHQQQQPQHIQAAYHQAFVQQQQQQQQLQQQQQHPGQPPSQPQSRPPAAHIAAPPASTADTGKQTSLNPDAVEFKPGTWGSVSSVASSPIPPTPQQQPPKPVQLVPSQASEKGGNMMMVQQPLAVIPSPQTMVSQYGQPVHHGPPLVALYPTSTLVQRGYLAPAALAQQHPTVSMAAAAAAHHHHHMVTGNHHDNTNSPAAGVMSPTSPTSQPAQIVYHPQHSAQMATHNQFIQQSHMQTTQMPTSGPHILQIHSGQMPHPGHIPPHSGHVTHPAHVTNSGGPGAPYANPLQPHHQVFHGYPPTVG